MINSKEQINLNQFNVKKKVIVKFNSNGIKGRGKDNLQETITSHPTSITIDSQSLL